MKENVYKVIRFSGVFNLVLGIFSVVAGVAAGVLLIVNGAKLLQAKKDVLI